MSSERPKIPVEPLSEARWAKVDDAVFAALDRDRDAAGEADAMGRNAMGATRPRSSRALVVGAASVLALAAAVLVFLSFRGGDRGRGDMVLNPSHIETGTTASRLAVGESTIQIGPASAVVASGDDAHGILVVVEKGQVDCEVTPRKGRPPFVVQAANVRVRVVGTRFVVARDGGAVRVSVAHGAVEVSRGAEVVMLHDGESWPGESGSGSASAGAGGSAGASGGAGGAATAAAVRDGKDAQRAYEAAARMETSDPDGAMGSYRRLAAGGGPWAPTALFAAGRLAADRGRNAEAKRLLEDYLARYPRGANAEDARGILARLR